MIKMGLKGLVLGGLIGFGVGVYHGYNYAAEECRKECLHGKATVAYETRQQPLDYSYCIENPIEDIVGKKAKVVYVGLR
jgi:hypothetical protein